MPRTPLAALAPTILDFAVFTAEDFKPGSSIARVSLGGETLYVHSADWERACEHLVGRFPGAGAPKVETCAALAAAPLTAPQPAPAPTTAVAVVTRPSPLPAAPAPVRGQTVDLEGAMRSGADLLAAEAAGFAPAQPYFTRGTMVIDVGVENARRSRIEHDAKPSVADACHDFVARVATEARADEVVAVRELSMDLDGSIFDADGEGRYVLSRPAFDGLCRQLGFGGAAYLAKCWPELRRHNVNAWLDALAKDEDDRREKHEIAQIDLPPAKRSVFESNRMCFRTRNGAAGREVFGVVSPSYTSFDVDRVAEALAIAAPPDAKCVIDYDGTRARFEVMFHSDIAPEKYVAGEFFKAGVVINTNDIGGGSLRGSAVVYQNLCLNLICIDEARSELFAIRHTGSVTKMVEGFRHGFRKALSRLDHFLKAWNYALTDDVVAAARAVDPEVPMKVEEALPGLFTAIVERELVPVRGRTADVVPQLMQMWREDTSAAAGPTRGAIVNAFTRYAHRVNDDAFFADEVQKAAGQLLFGRKGAKPAPLPWMPVEA